MLNKGRSQELGTNRESNLWISTGVDMFVFFPIKKEIGNYEICIKHNQR
jgi:hypothetical protein